MFYVFSLQVYLVTHKGHTMAYNSLINADYLDDFLHGMNRLRALSPDPHVTQLIGFCEDIGHDAPGEKRITEKSMEYILNNDTHAVNLTSRNNTLYNTYLHQRIIERDQSVPEKVHPVYVTEYHPLGNAANFADLLNNEMKLVTSYNITSHDNICYRFSMCIQYVDILAFLHSSPLGTLVMCDSNDLMKTLSQYLLTSDLSLVVNDLDATPDVNDDPYIGIKCGHQQLFGDFVAPEQLWTQSGRFRDSLMSTYNEQVDIWKIPDVCSYFLGSHGSSHSIKFHLFNIHKRCKHVDPTLRSSAREVLREYHRIWNLFGFVR